MQKIAQHITVSILCCKHLFESGAAESNTKSLVRRNPSIVHVCIQSQISEVRTELAPCPLDHWRADDHREYDLLVREALPVVR